jgi:predicted TIM-barrel fold metal-dependent hydrolase
MIIKDAELLCACVRAYNEFALELGEASGGRIVPLATLPAVAPEKCAAEARWAAERGFRGVELNPMHAAEPLWADAWDKLYDTVEEAGIPLCMHIADARDQEPVKHHGQWGAHVVRASFAITEAVTALLFSGALERRPGLRLLLGECRIGWLPFVIQQAQQAALERDTDLPLSLTPAEVWQRQIAATFEEDRIGAHLLASPWARLAGSVMWATDYPHNHNVCFDPHPVLDELFADVPDDIADHACYGKAAEWFGI